MTQAPTAAPRDRARAAAMVGLPRAALATPAMAARGTPATAAAETLEPAVSRTRGVTRSSAPTPASGHRAVSQAERVASTLEWAARSSRPRWMRTGAAPVLVAAPGLEAAAAVPRGVRAPVDPPAAALALAVAPAAAQGRARVAAQGRARAAAQGPAPAERPAAAVPAAPPDRMTGS